MKASTTASSFRRQEGTSPVRPSAVATRRAVGVCKSTGFLASLIWKKRNNPQVKVDRDRLLQLLLTEEQGPVDRVKQIDALVDNLASTNLPFTEAKLGGGPWLVLHTKGDLQLWRATYNALDGNTASQDFNPVTRSAVNRAEYYGGNAWVSATGSYDPLDESTNSPKPIRADIEGGRLHLWGWELPLPFIRGSGTFEVMYLDNELRVFRSGSSYAVQVKASALEQLRKQLIR